MQYGFNTVHPHGRGEHPLVSDSPQPITGSSPRAWGTLTVHPYARGCYRFIPTGVGNTVDQSVRRIDHPVHPHGRGEHGVQRPVPAGDHGSSPRAWGTQVLYQLLPAGKRFIPTGVGNTGSSSIISPMISVHPHGRGEHMSQCHIIRIRYGSSPRAWGTRMINGYKMLCRRFIPTGVGNTLSLQRIRGIGTVHPHGRGEHARIVLTTIRANGSSPRAWGTLKSYWTIRKRIRFIPTGVGNTCAPHRVTSHQAVHPHGRGEHGVLNQRRGLNAGSSPRAWGTQPHHSHRELRRRFIPTGVGNTVCATWPLQVATVHPHGRGEHTIYNGLL